MRPWICALPLWATLLQFGTPGALAGEPSPEPVGLAQLRAFDRLPYLKPGVTVHYEGSIDKRGGNADWDWALYEERGEWVIFDVDGPGCLYNFVQHRYPSSPEAVFRFYFDGEAQPRLTVPGSAFGHAAPLLAPLADAYLGPEDNGRGPIRVIRSFLPMPFAQSCKVTSSVRLSGPDKAKGEGGWGHIVYHTYPTATGVTTFTGQEDAAALLDGWRRVGDRPGAHPQAAATRVTTGTLTLQPGEAARVWEHEGAGAILALKLKVDPPLTSPTLASTAIRLTWDGHSTPDVDCPLGAFFGNEFGEHPIRTLAQGMLDDGTQYCYFPMPFWQSARVELIDQTPVSAGSANPARTIHWTIETLDAEHMMYPRERCGYFRAAYLPPTPSVPGRDTKIGRFTGRGHMVAGVVTARHDPPGAITCEGDVRVYIDGNATPQVESDGSESWSCYGWGFPTPPQCNPSSSYDGRPDSPWSMTRLCTGDWYPFEQELIFGIEHGGHNDQALTTSGAIFGYVQDAPGLVQTDTLDIGNEVDERAHAYTIEGQTWAGELESAYEGDFEDQVIKDQGRAFNGASEFTLTIDPHNDGVRLRRRADQEHGRQCARVLIDGQPVTERSWLIADANPFRRWLDSDFEIPPAYTQGKKKIRVRLEYSPAGDAPAWNEFRYWAFSHRVLNQR